MKRAGVQSWLLAGFVFSSVGRVTSRGVFLGLLLAGCEEAIRRIEGAIVADEAEAREKAEAEAEAGR